jgi:hypothetical protein
LQHQFEVGAKVYSQRYGVGEVLTVEGFGDAEKLTIRFDAAGTLVLMPSTHNLEPAAPPVKPAAPPAQVPSPAPAVPHVVGSAVPASGISGEALKEAVREVLREELGFGETRMMERWKGGRMILKPARGDQKEKEIPLDDFFHKIVMLRDRLRVLEQKINAHAGMSAAEKVELQQYITRIYGSLTTFNVLFADREDWFVGQKGEG